MASRLVRVLIVVLATLIALSTGAKLPSASRQKRPDSFSVNGVAISWLDFFRSNLDETALHSIGTYDRTTCDGPGSLAPGCTSMYYLSKPEHEATFINAQPGNVFVYSAGPVDLTLSMMCGTRELIAPIKSNGCYVLRLVGRPDLCHVRILADEGDISLYACV